MSPKSKALGKRGGSPTATKTATSTKTSTVANPHTQTSTVANPEGNITVTGGAGSGDTTVTIHVPGGVLAKSKALKSKNK